MTTVDIVATRSRKVSGKITNCSSRFGPGPIDYDWPGNVRELENALQYALVKCRGNVLLPEHLPSNIYNANLLKEPCPTKEDKKRKHKLDIETVWQMLAETGGNKIEAAHRLGVSRATLYRFIEESEKTGKIKAV